MNDQGMISGTISFDDFLAAQRLHGRRTFMWLFVGITAAWVIGVLMMVMRVGFSPGWQGIAAGAAGIVAMLFAYWFYTPRKLRRLYRQQASLRDSLTYSWDDESLRVETARGHGKRLWADYVRVREDQRMFLLYHNDMLFDLLMKSWFCSQEQVDAFRRLAERGVRSGQS